MSNKNKYTVIINVLCLLVLIAATSHCSAQEKQDAILRPSDSLIHHQYRKMWTRSDTSQVYQMRVWRWLDSATRYQGFMRCAKKCAPDSVKVYKQKMNDYYYLLKLNYGEVYGLPALKRMLNDKTSYYYIPKKCKCAVK